MDRFPVEMDTSRLTGRTGPKGAGGLVKVCTCVVGDLLINFAYAWLPNTRIRVVSVGEHDPCPIVDSKLRTLSFTSVPGL